jgi:peptidylprolyl isomerase domain and WD repeat-containing protein 1
MFLHNLFCFTLRTDFLVTASCDGHVKFWKKTEEGIEFVKHFRSHLGEGCICAECDETLGWICQDLVGGLF